MTGRAILRLAACTALAGCMPETTTPPLRPVLLEAPSVLGRGRTGILAQFAERAPVGEPAVDAWTVRARHGFGGDVEGSFEASYVHDSASNRTPTTASGVLVRAGVRYRFWESANHRMGTFFAGLGGGSFDRGETVGGDLGLLLGTDLVFVILRLWASGTVGARVVDDGYYQPVSFCILFCSNDPPVDYRNQPRVAAGFDTLLGLHAPIADWGDGRIELIVGGGFVQTLAAEYHVGVAAGSGLDFVF